MSKHTPGPWKRDGWNIVCDTAHIASASVSDVGPEQAYANAHLMAAALDMYEALAHIVRLMEEMQDDGKLDVAGLAALIKAEAALAKARG